MFVLHFFFNEYSKPFKLPCFKICNKINNGINWLRDCCTAPQLMNLSCACHPKANYEQFTGKKNNLLLSRNSRSSIEMPSSINLVVFLLTIIQLMKIRRRIRIARESERRRRAALIRLARRRQIVSVSLLFNAFLIRVISVFLIL